MTLKLGLHTERFGRFSRNNIDLADDCKGCMFESILNSYITFLYADNPQDKMAPKAAINYNRSFSIHSSLYGQNFQGFKAV